MGGERWAVIAAAGQRGTLQHGARFLGGGAGRRVLQALDCAQLLQREVPQAAVASLNVSGADGFALPQRLPEPGGVDDRVEGAVVCCAAGGVGKERVVFAAGASLPCSRDRAVSKEAVARQVHIRP